MVGCAAYGCKSHSSSKEPGVTFHRFPKDIERLNAWTNNMKIADWQPSNNDRLCSKHFESHFLYRTDQKVRLLNEAVPTIFLELPKYLQPKRAKKRTRHVSPESMPSTSGVDQDTPRKKKLRRQLFRQVAKSREKTKKIRALRQSLKRAKKKVVSLKQIIKELEKKNLLSQENVTLIENMSNVNRELLKRKVGKRVQYSPELRKFALTLNFFSPKAYNYVRQIFDTCLPHHKTIAKWLQNVNAEPGFTKEALYTLKNKVQLSERPILCYLIIDEMAIRKHIEWDGKKFHGYVSFGVDLNDDSNAMAKEAFVLMLVCINGTWKLPIGYFFTDSLNGNQKHSVVSQCINLVEGTGAKVMSVTFDGAPSNISMSCKFGCLVDLPHIKTSFQVTDHNMYIFYDPCHMIKLIRNTFGERKVLIDRDGNFIKWEYVELLEELQTNEELHLGNKLRHAHVHFFKQKMKVRLAVQLLSESVADAISYCDTKLGLKNFKGSQGTVNFIRIMNKIFDVLNSRSLVAPNFKKALCQKNIDQSIQFTNDAIIYISNLKFANQELVIKSNRKIGFIGLIISLNSAMELYKDLVCDNNLIYFPLYKISQDHLELFFSSVRSKGGWNNNPTARQFMGAFKRLLVRAEIREGGMGNCMPLDQIPILNCASKNNISAEDQLNVGLSCFFNISEPPDSLNSIWKDHDYIMNNTIISNCSSQIVQYIAGFISRRLQRTIKCESCVTALTGNKADFLHSLIEFKSRGGLMYPSDDVISICLKSEHFLRMNENHLHTKNFVPALTNKIVSSFLGTDVFKCLETHVLENEVNHIYFLIKAVCTNYLNVRIHFIVKSRTQQVDSVRSKFTKLILFKGQ